MRTEIWLRGGKYAVETRTSDGVLFATMTAATIEEALELKERINEALAIGIEASAR
jgi:hypothetical protein